MKMRTESDVDFSFRQMLPSLALDVAMPILVFFALTSYGISKLLALTVGGVFPALNVGRTWIVSHKIQPLGIIVIAFMVLGTAGSLISGSVFFVLVKESILTASFGLLCLGSLSATERPLMFYILRQFVAGDHPARLQWWEGLWQHPRFRAAQRLVTAVWGLVYVIEASIGLAFACLLAPAHVVIISPAMALGVLVALAAWTRRYLVSLREQYGVSARLM